MCCPFAAKPLIISIVSTEGVIEGKKFEVVCNIDGIPVPNVTWLKDNLPHSSVEKQYLQMSRTGGGMEAIITIIRASTFNNGRYTCVASNPAGSVNMTIDIRVQASKSTGLIIIHTYFVSIECGFSRYSFLSLNIRRCIKS